MIDKLVFRIFLLFSMYFSFVFAQESVSVSFSVDMNDVETNEEGVYLAGGVFGQEGYVMDDSNGDDIWELTLQFPHRRLEILKRTSLEISRLLVHGMGLKKLLV